MFNFLLTGISGMNKAVWKKMYNAPFMATMKDSKIGGFDVCILEVSTSLKDPFYSVKKAIGPILIKKYQIEIK